MSKIFASIIVVAAFSLVARLGYCKGKQSQIKENIKHEVMNTSGKWINEFKLAGE